MERQDLAIDPEATLRLFLDRAQGEAIPEELGRLIGQCIQYGALTSIAGLMREVREVLDVVAADLEPEKRDHVRRRAERLYRAHGVLEAEYEASRVYPVIGRRNG